MDGVAGRIRLRKHLGADALLAMLRSRFEKIPDPRQDPDISLADALMSGYAVFSLKCPSLLAFDEQRHEGNLRRMYGITRVPCDTQLRGILDRVEPEALRPAFTDLFRKVQRGGALRPYRFLGRYYLVSVDGTQYFQSEKLGCDGCLVKKHKSGVVTYSHQMLGAAIVHPDRREVIPLCPEPIIKQDGQQKNDCERNAAKRFLPQLRGEHPHLEMVIIEDGLASNAPHITELRAQGFHYILGAKPGDHQPLFAEVSRRLDAGQGEIISRTNPRTGRLQVCTIVRDVPLNASHPDLRVHYLGYREEDPQTQETVLRFSWVTDLEVTAANVWEMVRGGRVRWKIENETFNTLKNQGYHAEHNYGHGKQHLSVVLIYLMMLAFLVDQVQQLCCPLFQAAWKKLGSKRALWEKLRGTFDHFVVDSMQQLFEALVYGLIRTAPPIAYPTATPPAPTITDTS